MKLTTTIIRFLTGTLLIFTSVTFLLNLIQPPELSGNVKIYMDGMMATGYMMTLVKIIELVCGIAFILNRYVALACILIAPIVVNIFLFHAYLDPSGLAIGVFLVFANVFLAYVHWDKYRPLFSPK